MRGSLTENWEEHLSEINDTEDLRLSARVSELLTKADDAFSTAFIHAEKADNPHLVTKAQVGLGKADNTADMDKPVSTAAATVINKNKIDGLKYTDDKTAETMSACNTYTNTKAVETVSACNTYTNTKATETVSACNTYTAGRLAEKSPLTHTHGLENEDISGVLSLNKGGTGATTAAAAREALGVPPIPHIDTTKVGAWWVYCKSAYNYQYGLKVYLPAGGTWVTWTLAFNAANASYGATTHTYAGFESTPSRILPGSSECGYVNVDYISWFVFALRIA